MRPSGISSEIPGGIIPGASSSAVYATGSAIAGTSREILLVAPASTSSTRNSDAFGKAEGGERTESVTSSSTEPDPVTSAIQSVEGPIPSVGTSSLTFS